MFLQAVPRTLVNPVGDMDPNLPSFLGVATRAREQTNTREPRSRPYQIHPTALSSTANLKWPEGSLAGVVLLTRVGSLDWNTTFYCSSSYHRIELEPKKNRHSPSMHATRRTSRYDAFSVDPESNGPP